MEPFIPLSPRMEARLARLDLAHTKVCLQIDALNSQKRVLDVLFDQASVKRLARKNAKMLDLARSMDYIRRFGMERLPNGNPTSVNIGVPAAGAGEAI